MDALLVRILRLFVPFCGFSFLLKVCAYAGSGNPSVGSLRHFFKVFDGAGRMAPDAGAVKVFVFTPNSGSTGVYFMMTAPKS